MGGSSGLYEIPIYLFSLLFSLCVHEAAHAVVADRCGDPSARLLGRATLNPFAHIDPIGTVVMPLLMVLTQVPFLIGWAKPVPYNPRNLKDIRRDPLLIALAGPVSNLLLAFASALLLKLVIMVEPWLPAEQLVNMFALLLFTMIMVNLMLMLFNMIPVPPLDGHHLLEYFLPPQGQRALERIGPFGIIIAMVIAYNFLPIPFRYLNDLVSWFVLGGHG